MIKAVIFDFDDTLIRTYDTFIDSLGIFTERGGLPMPTESKIRENYGKSCAEIASILWPGAQVDKIVEEISTLLIQKHPIPVKGVHEILDVLSRNLVLGIVTGRPRSALTKSLMGAKIDFKKFAFTLTQDDIQKPKSDPGYFDSAMGELGKLGISKDEVLFVGDSVHDLETAQNTGIRFVGVLTGLTVQEDFVQKGLQESMIIPSVMELPLFIQDNGF